VTFKTLLLATEKKYTTPTYIKIWKPMSVANTACIIYTNDIEAVKLFEIGSYPGKALPYNEIAMWTNGLKRLSVNLELAKDKFVNVIN
jgi:hypothetical protein